MEKALKDQTLSDYQNVTRHGMTTRAAIRARRRLERIAPCLSLCPASVEAYMIAAANARFLKRYDQAVELYRAALRFDQRPEIYFNLGLSEIAAGHREEGIEYLVLAGRSGGYWNLIEDEAIRNEVTRRLFYVPAPRF